MKYWFLILLVASQCFAARRRTLTAEVGGKTDASRTTYAQWVPEGGWTVPVSWLWPDVIGTRNSGNLAYRFQGNGDNNGNIRELIQGTSTYSPTFPWHAGAHFYFPAGSSNNPTSDITLIDFTNNTTDNFDLVWTKTGYLAIARLGVKYDSIAIVTNTQTVIAMETDWANPSHDTIVVDFHGTVKTMVYTGGHTGSSASMNTAIGWSAISGNGTGTFSYFYVDDYMENDASGSFETGMPDTSTDAGIIAIPLSVDSSRGTWLGGNGGTSNLSSTAFTLPVPGKTTEQDWTNIKNLTASTSEKFFAQSAAYSGLIPSGKVAKVVWAVVRTGEDATSGTSAGNVQLYTNPTDAGATSFNFGNDLGAHLNDSTAFRGNLTDNLWYSIQGAYVYSPTLNTSIGGTVMIEKTTNSVKQGCIDGAWIFVQYGASSSGSTTIFNTSEK